LESAIGDSVVGQRLSQLQSFGASWELDVLGRIGAESQAADAQVLATLFNYDDVLRQLIAEVATNYVLLRSLEEELVVAQEQR